MSDCVFCAIVAGTVPAEVLQRSEHAIAIRDLNPQAPTHVLVIPTRHAAHLSEFLALAGEAEAGALLSLASRIGASAPGDGYRVVVNEGTDGGQTVAHLHLHVLAGRGLRWPPG
ncbi:MAG: HIT domain-containing protein [Candidatus Baltobacteraceae bacterium]